ncbi:MAG: hypothetical protein AVDCRST_MAG56-5960 [uncultured Cytophagales bacterium]|uniref:Uncharacterized protein n=1 Tax=uncultured Cytophagales bacterium TaxID=158755 RepID=A0A6J4KLI2_9SPHI|nr:MAG: hypothetical protein AVDCRST_MAG56-5960 [uncultured Cytophagales bacterium]
MNTKQINQYDMYLRVQKALDTNKGVWTGNSRFTANYEAFVRNLQAIETLIARAEADSTSISRQKNAWREQLIDGTTRLVKKVLSFAADTQNKALAAQIDHSRSELRNLRESLLPGICYAVCEKAAGHLPQLAEYGVTEAEIAGLRGLADQFKAIIPEPKLAISTGKQVTGALADAFRQNNDLLREQLDGKLEQFKEGQPAFYAAYFDARNVIDRGGKKGEGDTEA